MAYIKKNVPPNNQLGFLLPGDVIYFKKKTGHLLIGDVILIEEKKELSIRKTVYISERYVLAEGQSKKDIRRKILPKHIIGKADFLIRDGQKIVLEDIYKYRAFLYMKEAIKITKELKISNIEFVFLKGIPIHMYYERTYPKRIFRDCDILIQANNFKKVRNILIKLGFNPIPNITNMNVKEFNFSKTINGIPVVFDVHTEIVFVAINKHSNLFYPEEKVAKLNSIFMNEKVFFTLHKEALPVLSAENFFIYSSLHLFNHNYTGTFRYELLKNVLLEKRLDLAIIQLRIQEFELENFIYPVLLFLKKYYFISVPHSFIKNVKPKKGIVSYIRKNIFKNAIFDESSIAHDRRIRLQYHFNLSSAPFYKKIIAMCNPPSIQLLTRLKQ